jgi:hypothetical protein
MQGRERVDPQLLDAGALVGHLVPTGSVFAFLAARRQDLSGDEEFVDLFPSEKGRPSRPPQHHLRRRLPRLPAAPPASMGGP